jgi:hypothetical protein
MIKIVVFPKKKMSEYEYEKLAQKKKKKKEYE